MGNRNHQGEKNPMWGKKHSLETCRKISNAVQGKKLSPEHRRKIGEAHKGKNHRGERNPMWGRKHSPEARQKISNACKGKKHGPFSLEHRKKIGDAQRGEKCYWWGKERSEETKEKISKANRGEKHPNWKGGRVNCRDHILLLKRNHPSASSWGYIREHRFIMEQYLGRLLKSEEVVHHINGIRDDNRIENLVLFSSQAEHMGFHNKEWWRSVA